MGFSASVECTIENSSRLLYHISYRVFVNLPGGRCPSNFVDVLLEAIPKSSLRKKIKSLYPSQVN